MILILPLIYSEVLLVTYQIQPAYAQGTSWYVGYFDYTPPGVAYSHPGVYGEILTIDANVPSITTNMYCEWVATILSYSPMYWVQVGYLKGAIQTWVFYSPHYYVEKMDQANTNGVSTFVPLNTSTPSAGSWHSYATRRPYYFPGESPPSYDPSEWRFYIDNMGAYVWRFFVTPYIPIDEQAFVEVYGTSQIRITGSHFRNLRFFDAQLYWYYWDRHVARADSPYTITEVSHHEFYANGGG